MLTSHRFCDKIFRVIFETEQKEPKNMAKQKIINIAVIAHVDAGKSTLVDAFLAQSGVFRENEEMVAQTTQTFRPRSSASSRPSTR